MFNPLRNTMAQFHRQQEGDPEPVPQELPLHLETWGRLKEWFGNQWRKIFGHEEL